MEGYVPKELIERQQVADKEKVSVLPDKVKQITHDYMLIEKLPQKGNIIVNSGGKTKEPELYRVKKIGPGHYEHGKLIIPTVKTHDIVFIIGPNAEIEVEGRNYQFARARDVVAVF